MKFFGLFILSSALILLLDFTAFGQEAMQEAKPDPAAPAKQEMRQDVKQDAAPAGEVKPETGNATHDHGKGTEKRFVATVGPDGVQHVEVIGGEYYFDPNYIVVKVNTPVELKVKKAPGIVSHDIVVKAPEAGIDFKTDLGKDWTTVTFTPIRVGKYEMFCDKKFLWFRSHKDRGMEGSIDVVP